MTISRSAYQDLVKENEGLKEQLDGYRHNAEVVIVDLQQQLDAAREREKEMLRENSRLIRQADVAVRLETEWRTKYENAINSASASELACQTQLLAQEERERLLTKLLAEMRALISGESFSVGLVKRVDAALAKPIP